MKIKICKLFEEKKETLNVMLSKEDILFNIQKMIDEDEENNLLKRLQKAYYVGSKIIIRTPYGKKVFEKPGAPCFHFEYVDLLELPSIFKYLGKYETEKLIRKKVALETQRPKDWLKRVMALNDYIFEKVNKNNDVIVDQIKKLKAVSNNDFEFKFSKFLTQLVRMARAKNNEEKAKDIAPLFEKCPELFEKRIAEIRKYNTKPVIGFNQKNKIEVHSELEFEEDLTRNKGAKPLTQAEKDLLRKYAVPFGIVQDISEIGQRPVTESKTQTERGYAVTYRIEEIPKEAYFDEYDKSYIRSNSYYIQDTTLEREQFECLVYVLKNAAKLPNYGLISGYTICPVCGEVMHEFSGCPNGCVPEIKTVDYDKISVGIDGEYVDHGFASELETYFDRHPELTQVTNITEKLIRYFENEETVQNILN